MSSLSNIKDSDVEVQVLTNSQESQTETNNNNEENNQSFVTVVTDTAKSYLNENFENIKETILKEIEGLEESFPILKIIKLLIEMVEKDGQKYQLNGEKKQEVVVLICIRLGQELKKNNIHELVLLGEVLSNRKSIEDQINIIFKIKNGELEINLNDGLEDEIEIITTCCSGLAQPILNYFRKKCKCIKTQKKNKKNNN